MTPLGTRAHPGWLRCDWLDGSPAHSASRRYRVDCLFACFLAPSIATSRRTDEKKPTSLWVAGFSGSIACSGGKVDLPREGLQNLPPVELANGVK